MKPEAVKGLLDLYLGEEQNIRFTNYCFDHACEEADYLGVPKRGNPFFQLVRFRTLAFRHELLGLLEDYMNENGIVRFDLTFPDDERIR